MRRLLAMMAVVSMVNTAILFAEEPRGIVYDFGAKWCGPCQSIAPIVEKLKREGLPIEKVDYDEQRDLSTKFRIQKLPTFVLVVDGKEVDRTVGVMSEEDIRRMIARIPPAEKKPETAATQGRGTGMMSVPVSLGESAPLVRPAPMEPPVVTVSNSEPESKKSLMDLMPFGKKAGDESKNVVRANDSSVAGAMPEASTGEARVGDPMEASVRIRVITNGRIELGSGTVVSSKPGVSQILTCAHIFKEFGDDSRIEVDVFERGAAKTYNAGMIKFESEPDLGLIQIPTTNVLPVVKVAGVNKAPKLGDSVAAIGCSGGDEPTREQSKVLAIDKYEGPNNFICSGLPVVGRSGGGLFNSQGEIIAVCFAGDKATKEGVFSGLFAIHKLLDDCQLTALYAPSVNVTNGDESLFAKADAPAAQAPRELSVVDASPVAPIVVQGTLPRSESNTDIQAGDAEVVVIIRDRANPALTNRVVILHQASPKFLSYLNGELPAGEIPMEMLGAEYKAAEGKAIQSAVKNAVAQLPATRGSQLQATGMSSPVIPQKYVRSAARN
ncbi:thioredoxin domain-containing protein [Planctomicrobium sp. SH668]|uniref:thioredoxin domain-containing protein n=1 Tax=Planctomicrobium sp. SH668 TaxID=3448126 RepID=UPI003F5B6BF6